MSENNKVRERHFRHIKEELDSWGIRAKVSYTNPMMMWFELSRFFGDKHQRSLPEAVLWKIRKLGDIGVIDFTNYVVWVIAKNNSDSILFEMVFGIEEPEQVVQGQPLVARVGIEEIAKAKKAGEELVGATTYNGCDYTIANEKCGELATFEITKYSGDIDHYCQKHGEYVLKNKSRFGVRKYTHSRTGVVYH